MGINLGFWNTAKSIPAEKCLPVEDITITLASPLASMFAIHCGSSNQKSTLILFICSGRLSFIWAI